MARIRSLKPEAFESETLADTSLGAERTFFGLSTIVDDRGRITDKPAQVNGQLWSMRGGHSRDDLEAELAELVKVDLVCRYTGCDGRRYLHLVSWDRHQKIDRPSKSRLPRCPFHQVTDDYCGTHEGECITPEPSADSPDSSRDSRESSMQPREPSATSDESSMLDLGPRTVDRGSVPPSAGAALPAPNAGLVVAAYVEGALAAKMPRPDEALRKRVGKQAGQLIAQKTPMDVLLTAARHMGAVGWNDLGVQIQRDAANASPNGSVGKRPSRGGASDDLSGEVYGEGKTRI